MAHLNEPTVGEENQTLRARIAALERDVLELEYECDDLYQQLRQRAKDDAFTPCARVYLPGVGRLYLVPGGGRARWVPAEEICPMQRAVLDAELDARPEDDA